MILNKMEAGASKEELVIELDISHDLFWRLAKEEKEFSETIKKGMQLCKGWWLKKGRDNLENRNFSPVLWYMNMKNRFGWRDNRDLEINMKPLIIKFDSSFNDAKTSHSSKKNN